MVRTLLARLATPWTRSEAPGTWRILKTLGVEGSRNDHLWAQMSRTQVRGKLHGYQMVLHPSDWSDRITYFLGRYYDQATQQTLIKLLRRGDRFVDIGANTGMMTLLGASLVGAEGRVDAFEPHPDCVGRIREQVRINRIDHVHLHAMAVSDEESVMQLHAAPGHTGYSTLAGLESDEEARQTLTQEIDVRVGIADEVIDQSEQPVDVIKMDIEGFEPFALRGLSRTLERDHPDVITEINPCCLKRAQATSLDVISLLEGHGYEGYRIIVAGEAVVLERLPRPFEDHGKTIDTLWLHPERAARHDRLPLAA